MSNINASRDWEAIRQEWMVSGIALTPFARKKGIRPTTMQKQAEKGRWFQRRAEFNQKTLLKVEEKLSEKITEAWINQEKLWNAIEVQAAAILKRTLSPDGRIISPMDPGELSQLTQAIERALKARKLIRGEGTGEGTTINVENLSMQVLGWIEKANKEVDEQK